MWHPFSFFQFVSWIFVASKKSVPKPINHSWVKTFHFRLFFTFFFCTVEKGYGRFFYCWNLYKWTFKNNLLVKYLQYISLSALIRITPCQITICCRKALFLRTLSFCWVNLGGSTTSISKLSLLKTWRNIVEYL